MVQFADQHGNPGNIVTTSIPSDSILPPLHEINEMQPSPPLVYSPLSESDRTSRISDQSSAATDRTSVAISDRTSGVVENDVLISDDGETSLTPSTSVVTTVIDLSSQNTGIHCTLSNPTIHTGGSN